MQCHHDGLDILYLQDKNHAVDDVPTVATQFERPQVLRDIGAWDLLSGLPP